MAFHVRVFQPCKLHFSISTMFLVRNYVSKFQKMFRIVVAIITVVIGKIIHGVVLERSYYSGSRW